MIGKIVNGKYRITDKLGSGGNGAVYRACHIHLQTQWALKFLSHNEKQTTNEPEILKNLNHPAFPRLVDVIRESDEIILIYDYYQGPTLLKLIEQHGKIDEERVCHWAYQILDALCYLHNHSMGPLIYRDLKPSNLIVLPDDSIRIIDFGTARYFNQQTTDDTVYLGTPGYAAPEQYGLGQSDERTDIFNFGMTLFHLLTGTHPLQRNEIRMEKALNEAGVSNKLTEIILKCTARDPEDRYHHAVEMKDVFYNFVHQQIFMPGKEVVGRNGVEISVSGMQSGVGVTHFCFLFGIWLQNHGFRTAVVEYGEDRDAKTLCKLVEKESQVAKTGCFKIQGLSIYPSMDWEKVEAFDRADFDYILLDYGIHNEYVSSMMRRSDVKMVMAPGADWKMRQVEAFINKYYHFLNDKNTYLSFPLQSQKSIRIIRSYFKLTNMLTIPYVINPWKQNNDVKMEIENIYTKLFRTSRCFSKRRKREWHF